MTELKENVYKKANSKDEEDAVFENNFIKKNIYYFHNACTSQKYNFNSREISIENGPQWYETLERSNKIRKNRNSNLVIFGLNESKALTREERDMEDMHLFFKLIGELNSLFFSLFKVCCKITCQVDGTKRLDSKKETQSPAPLLIKLGGEKSQLTRNEILKAARELKKSTKFKNVFISPDLTVSQRRRLNELKLSRNELNDKLKQLPYKVNYYYGIRNDRLKKIRKNFDDIDEECIYTKTQLLSKDLKSHEKLLIDSLANIRSEVFNSTKKLTNTSNKNMQLIEKLGENIELVNNKVKEDNNHNDGKFFLILLIIKHILEKIGLDDTKSNFIKHILERIGLDDAKSSNDKLNKFMNDYTNGELT